MTCETRKYSDVDLDRELRRRQMFPPTSVQMHPDEVREEWTTVAALEAEFCATPLDHSERGWREWELALAKRQAAREPARRFYRVVERLTA